MNKPSFADYVQIICTLFDQFEQHRRTQQGAKIGKPYSYSEKLMIVFFVVMQFRRIFKFKTQHRWLAEHPERWEALGFRALPHRTTLSRRYKSLYETLPPFIEFLAQFARQLDELFSQAHLVEDKSLFKALGPVWHQSDRQAGRIPAKLRHLDSQASWGKSGYQGWVYGYGLHLTCNQAAFPHFVEVTTAS